MQFNSHATNQDCVSEILKICGATTATYPLVDITRRFNSALDDYFSTAFESDGRWNFDDINQSNPPIDTQNLVSGTNKYKVGSFTEKLINLIRLEILDSSSVGYKLKPESFQDLDDEGSSFETAYSTSTTGLPTRYLKYGDFIYLRVTPNYNKTGGLKAYFDRPASYMASTDTTKVPGVPVIHHNYLCRKAAVPFLIEKNLPQLNGVLLEIQRDEKSIKSYFARRTKDEPKRLVPFRQNNR